MKKPVKETYGNQLECPYCGYIDNDSWELADEDEDYECPNCEEHFSYESYTERNFTAWTKETKEVEY